MAFDLIGYGGYGTGSLQDFDVKASEKFSDFNSYARVTKISNNLIDLDLTTARLGRFEKFEAGNDILIHASTSSGLNRKIGKVICARITVADGEKLTLDKDIETVFTNADLLDYNIQAITFANFHCLNIFAGGSVSPLAYDYTKLYGGILAIKCSYKWLIEGGAIDLEECGIPCYQKESLRPLTNTELTGELDSDPSAGKENLFEDNVFPLNAGDGAVFLLAKQIEINDNGRIGNTKTHGKPDCLGAIDSPFRPSNITNIGGSSILIVSDKQNIKAVNLAKYRNREDSLAMKGKGLARCYIANPELPKHIDDKLYHADIISNPRRPSRKLKIYDFGSGSYGDLTNPTYNLNCAAKVITKYKNQAVAIHDKGYGLADFREGTRVFFNVTNDPSFARILKVENTGPFEDSIIFDSRVPDRADIIIAVPEFENFTLTENYSRGSVFCIQVANKCKISAKIDCPVIIIARNLEFDEGAAFTSTGLIVCDSLTGFNNLQLSEPIMLYNN